MNISNVTKEDLINCAQLARALSHAKFEVSGPDVVALSSSVRWLAGLAQAMSDAHKKVVPVEKAADRPMSVKPNPVSKPLSSSKRK